MALRCLGALLEDRGWQPWRGVEEAQGILLTCFPARSSHRSVLRSSESLLEQTEGLGSLEGESLAGTPEEEGSCRRVV